MSSSPRRFRALFSVNRDTASLGAIALAMAGTLAWSLGSAAAQDQLYAPEMVVTASRIPVPAKETGSAVTVITAEELEERGTRIVSDVLRDVPGLNVNRTGPVGGTTQVRIRGAEGNHTLVLIDGIEVNNPAGGSEFQFQNLLAAQIERIEVLRGPQSALYGSDAIGGVINIITRRPDRGWSGQVAGEVGSHDRFDGNASLGYGTEKFGVTGSLARLRTNGISIADSRDGNTEKDAYRNFTGRVKAQFQPLPNLTFDGVFMHIDSDFDNDESAVVVNVKDGDKRSKTIQRYKRVGAQWSLFDGAWEHRANIGRAKEQSEFYNGAGVKTYSSHGQRTKTDYETTLRLSGPEPGQTAQTLTLGAEHENDRLFTNSSSGANIRTIENYGYFGEYRLGLWDRLFLSGSVRFDDSDPLFRDEVTWRGTAAWLHAAWQTRFHGSVGRSVKNPTLFELFGSTSTFTGNPDLLSEEALGFDIGAERSFLGDRATVDVTLFQNNIRNLIDGNGSSATNKPGTSRIRGIEISAQGRLRPDLRVNANYTYTLAEDAGGTQLVRRPRHQASLNAVHDFEMANRPARGHLGVNYNGPQTDSVTLSYSPSRSRTANLGGYTLVSAGVSWWLQDQVELFVRGRNLLDSDYQEVFGYGALGRTVYGGLRINFGGPAS